MLCHIEHHMFPFVFISATVKQCELLLVFFLGYCIECYLVEIFEHPGLFEGVAVLRAEDIDSRDGHPRELVSSRRLDIVKATIQVSKGFLLLEGLKNITYAMQDPPHETCPSGVNTLLGFIFGQFIRCRGSAGRQSGSAVKKPTATTIKFAVRYIFSNCSRVKALFFATKSTLSGR
jgi:hypothetical protein